MDRHSLSFVILLLTAPALAAQSPPNACGLLTKAEVETLINRGQTVSGMPDAIPTPGGKGSVCVYPGGALIALYPGPNSAASFDVYLRAQKITEKDKKPVSGIGDKAYMYYITSNNPIDHGAYLVMTVGEHIAMTQIAAHVGALEGPGHLGVICKFPKDLDAAQKAECDKAMADKSESPEAVGPAVRELAKVVAAKVRAGKF